MENESSPEATDIKTKPDVPDAMIEHPDSKNILVKITNFKKTCKMLENGEMNPEKQDSCPLPKEKTLVIKKKRPTKRTTKKKDQKLKLIRFLKVLNWTCRKQKIRRIISHLTGPIRNMCQLLMICLNIINIGSTSKRKLLRLIDRKKVI